MSRNDGVAFARTGTSNPGGVKNDDRLDVPIPSDLKEQVAALAIAHGYGSAAEYVRELLYRTVHGELTMLQAYARRSRGSMG